MDARRIKKGSFVPCTFCGKQVYKMQSKIRKFNFCSNAHRFSYLKSPMNTSMSKGWHHKEETIKIIRQSSLDRDYNAVLTDKSRQKMADTARKRLWTDEQREAARQRKLGKKNTEEQNQKIRDHAMYGKDNIMWKENDDEITYADVHLWAKRHIKEPKICVHRGAAIFPILACAGRMELSNKDHKYHRVIEDWKWRCTLHHRMYDWQHGLIDPKGMGKRFIAKFENIKKREFTIDGIIIER